MYALKRRGQSSKRAKILKQADRKWIKYVVNTFEINEGVEWEIVLSSKYKKNVTFYCSTAAMRENSPIHTSFLSNKLLESGFRDKCPLTLNIKKNKKCKVNTFF